MKRIVPQLLLAATLAFLFQSPTRSQEPGSQTRTRAQQDAIMELNETARHYREGDFAEAQKHAERALLLDPLSTNAPAFLARVIHAQYKPGNLSEANVSKAREAINAYKNVLVREPNQHEAYQAVAYLYGALKEDELLRDWVLQYAVNPNVSSEKRAEAFVVVGSKDWDCSFKITELPANKTVTIRNNRPKVYYQKPENPTEFERARTCAARGLEVIEAAIALTPLTEVAWVYKANLLLEMAKLAEMDEKPQLKHEYEKQANEARRTVEEVRKRGLTAKPE